MTDKAISVIDATLSEGLKSSRIDFSIDTSIEIAEALSSIGIDMIECGAHSKSKEDAERVARIASVNRGCPILTPSSPTERDIFMASYSKADWVGICGRVRNTDRKRDRDKLLDQIKKSILNASKNGLNVRCTLEYEQLITDRFLIRFFDTAICSNASRISLEDRAGILEPNEIRRLVKLLKKCFPNIELEIRAHDDRGLAIANTLAAVEAGADWVSASVNGLGERAGITDLTLLLANLHFKKKRLVRTDLPLKVLSIKVAAYSRSPVDPKRPVIGDSVFDYLQHGDMTKDSPNGRILPWIPPKLFGIREPISSPKLPVSLDKLIVKPNCISSEELPFHKKGPGLRYVLIDERFVSDCRQYCIVRKIDKTEGGIDPHVELHRHSVDSLYIFLGMQAKFQGLCVEISLEKEVKKIESPATVFIPSGMMHKYRIISGRGIYINHVLAGEYSKSILHGTSERIESICTTQSMRKLLDGIL